MTTAELGERIARLEGEIHHVATKADLAQLETRLLIRLGGLMIVLSAVILGAMRLWL